MPMNGLYRATCAGWLALATLLIGCAKAGPPPPEPTVSLGARSCVSEPDLSTAQQVVLDEEKETKITLDAYSACWESPDRKRGVYAVFSLPSSSGAAYLISITSEPLGKGLFAPRVLMLDAKGRETREISRDKFVNHGAALYVGIRSHPGEEYLIVVSDPDMVGKQVSQIQGAVNASTVSTGTGAFNVYTGSESTKTYTLALNGVVSVKARPIPKAN